MKTALIKFLRWLDAPLPWIRLDPLELFVAVGIIGKAFEYGIWDHGGMLLVVGLVWVIQTLRVDQLEQHIKTVKQDRDADVQWFTQRLAKARAEYLVLGGLFEMAGATADPIKAAELRGKAFERYHVIASQYQGEIGEKPNQQ